MEEQKKMTLEEAKEKLRDEIENAMQEIICKMNEEGLLEFVNEVRNDDGDGDVYEMNEDNFNEALSGMEPYDVVNLADGFDMNCNYFSYNGWDLYEYNDLDETIDIDTVIGNILDYDKYLDANDMIRELHDDYTEKLEEIERRYARMSREECEQKMAELAKQFIAVAKEYDENCDYINLTYMNDDGDNYFTFYNRDDFEKGKFPISYRYTDKKEEE